ncbi:MAG TPA: hypothetical protein PLF01_00290, partial [Alphaproteobacteria bacterium]|nr:hypothetical protein [Alphaproteobacteria bacterium]
MTLPNQIADYFEAERAGNPLNGLISELLTVGDALHDARREHHDSCDLIDEINSSDHGFTLKYKEGAAEKSPIRPSKIRESLGIPEEDSEDVVLSRDAIKIKFSCKDKRKLLIDFDAAANFKDR